MVNALGEEITSWMVSGVLIHLFFLIVSLMAIVVIGAPIIAGAVHLGCKELPFSEKTNNGLYQGAATIAIILTMIGIAYAVISSMMAL